MLCRTCGNLLVRGQTICDMCGETVGANSLSQFGEQPYIAKPRRGIQAPRPPISPIQTPIQTSDEQSSSSKPEQSKSKWVLIVSIICASSAMLIAGCTLGLLKIFGFI